MAHSPNELKMFPEMDHGADMEAQTTEILSGREAMKQTDATQPVPRRARARQRKNSLGFGSILIGLSTR